MTSGQSLVSQNKDTTAMLESQTNPMGVQLFSNENSLSFAPINLQLAAGHASTHTLYV